MKKNGKKVYDVHKKMKCFLYTTFKKNERMDFCIDFLGRVLYIYVMKAIAIGGADKANVHHCIEGV